MSYTTRKMKDGRIELRKKYECGVEIRVYPKPDGTYNPHIFFEDLNKSKVKFLKSINLNVSKSGYTNGNQMQVTFKKNVIKSFDRAIERARSLELIAEMMVAGMKANDLVNSLKVK